MNGPRLSVAMFFFNHAFVSSLIHSLDGPHRTTAVAYFWDLQQIPHTILSRIAPPLTSSLQETGPVRQSESVALILNQQLRTRWTIILGVTAFEGFALIEKCGLEYGEHNCTTLKWITLRTKVHSVNGILLNDALLLSCYAFCQFFVIFFWLFFQANYTWVGQMAISDFGSGPISLPYFRFICSFNLLSSYPPSTIALSLSFAHFICLALISLEIHLI